MDRSHWTSHGDVRLHYLMAEPASGDDGRMPVLFVPGLSDWSTDYEWLLSAWAPRRTVIVDLRGRGLSDAPESGYRLEDHMGDLEAVVAAAGLKRFHLVAFSRGTCYALALALHHPEGPATLSVGDYQAKQMALPPGFPDWWMSTRWRGRPMTEIMAPHVITALQRDSPEMFFWDQLGDLHCPVLVIQAGDGLLDDEGAARWRTSLPGVEMTRFPESPHDLFRPDRFRFARVVGEFMAGHERADAVGR